VLYLALEDHWRRLHERMRLQGWTPAVQEQVDFLTLQEFITLFGDLRRSGGHLLAAAIRERRYRLVVIDTLSRAIWGNQSDVNEMTRWLSPLQGIAFETSCTLLLLDHHRKLVGGSPDAVADMLGSQAKGAVADTIWGLYRERSKHEGTLVVVGRDVKDHSLAVRLDRATCCWHVEGDAAEVAISAARRRVLEAVEALGQASLMQIVGVTGDDPSNTSKLLRAMAADGLLRVESAQRGKIYRPEGGDGDR
jgi:hypothetical protein